MLLYLLSSFFTPSLSFLLLLCSSFTMIGYSASITGGTGASITLILCESFSCNLYENNATPPITAAHSKGIFTFCRQDLTAPLESMVYNKKSDLENERQQIGYTVAPWPWLWTDYIDILFLKSNTSIIDVLFE